MIIEMRTYRLKPGMREEFLKVFEAKSVPEHRRLGMKMSQAFRSIEEENTFFFMRGFPDEESREALKASFYEGTLWKQELEHVLMPMIESYDVVVVDAAGGVGVS